MTHPCLLPCSHLFCVECIKQAFPSQGFGNCPICRAFVGLVSTMDVRTGAPITKSTPWPPGLAGSVFAQGMTLGLASYHFEVALPSSQPYISYESPLCAHWPGLDDGSRLPPRKPFTEVEINEAAGTFKGTIEWPAPATWRGDAKWNYTMHFSPDCATIMRGEVKAFSANGALASEATRGRSAPPDPD